MIKQPRRLFRSRANPAPEVIVEHDHDCRYPAGGECTCITGLEISTVGIDPRNN
jgi:hypothetical protein